MKYKRQHEQLYSVINSSSLYCHVKIETILNYICTFNLTEIMSVTHEQVQVSVNSMGVLFIYLQAQDAACEKLHLCPSYLLQTYRQPNGDQIAFSPLSRFLFPSFSRSSLIRSFRATPTFVTTMPFMLFMLLTRVRRYLFICHTWKTLLNHVFEDL